MSKDQVFWMEDPAVLMNKDYIREIWPQKSMDPPAKLNAITRFVITETIVAPRSPVRIRTGPELVWVSARELAGVALSGPHRRWINEILGRDGGDDAQAPKR